MKAALSSADLPINC